MSALDLRIMIAWSLVLFFCWVAGTTWDALPFVERDAVLGAKPAQLREYVGHELDALNEHELVELRGLYAAIRDGQISMAQAIEERRTDPGASTTATAAKPATRTAGVKDALNRARKSAAKEATASDASGERLDYDPSAGEAPPNDVPA